MKRTIKGTELRMRPAVRATPKLLTLRIDVRLLVCALLALAAGVFAYQAPAEGTVPVGWLGDRLFLAAGAGASSPESIRLYADELTPGAPGDRSRWTRRQALLTFPGLGQQPLSVDLTTQGWPAVPAALAVRQPEITLLADGAAIGRFTPDGSWQTHRFLVPAATRSDGNLELLITASHTFSESLSADGALIADPRPKGLRLAQVTVQGRTSGLTRLLAPDWPTVWQLVLMAALLYLGLRRLLGRPDPAFVVTILLIAGAALALALARLWAAVLIPEALLPVLVLLALGYRKPLLKGYGELLRRYSYGGALGYGLLVAGLAWMALTIMTWVRSRPIFDSEGFWANFPDSLLYVVLTAALLALVLVQGRNGLPRALAWFQQRLLSGRLALILLLALGGTWIGYQALLLRDLPAIGHADYADNGVVARNLLYGRGYVVDYVSQYYTLYNSGASVTRPQETWPLLQPIWILPFFSAFGPSAWAARLPNLVFNGLLLLLIYNIGEQLWDRRVGLCAALLILTNTLFFNTAIYATSDLAFVVFATAAVYCLYLAFVSTTTDSGQGTGDSRRQTADGSVYQGTPRYLLLAGAGLMTGLMLLQRPSSGLIAAGMGLWLLGASYRLRRETVRREAARSGDRETAVDHLRPSQHPQASESSSLRGSEAPRLRGSEVPRFRGSRSRVMRLLAPGLVWGLIALALLSPYLARNVATFGKPFYSTESHDAWVIEYSPDWDDIYNIYVESPPLDGPGVPERSWVLRWGFDTTLRKIERQWVYLGNLLLPSWHGGPISLATKPEQNSITLLHTMGGWLALIALPLALWRRPRLLGLLMLAFGPYLLFLIYYWHIEERYLPVLMPWLALLGINVLWKIYDRLVVLHDGRWSGLALAGVIAVIVAIVQPSWPVIAAKIRDEPLKWAPDLEAYQWLRTLPPETVVMSRGPWQLNFYSERPAIMTPNTDDVDKLLYVASYYRARYLVVETIQNTGAAGQRALQQLTLDRAGGEECRPTPEGVTRPGRRLPIAYCSRFYELEDGSRYQTVVYRFPENYGGVATAENMP